MWTMAENTNGEWLYRDGSVYTSPPAHPVGPRFLVEIMANTVWLTEGVCARSDVVIATAVVFGREAPRVITRDMQERRLRLIALLHDPDWPWPAERLETS